jgi:hypothetical protein
MPSPASQRRCGHRVVNAVMAALGSAMESWKISTGRAHDASDNIIYETDTGKLF